MDRTSWSVQRTARLLLAGVVLLGLSSCQSPAAKITPLPLPTLADGQPVPVIVDDDGSPDGMLALLYFLNNPLFEVRAVTVSYGEAHPAVFAPHVQQLLEGLGRGEIPVGAGRDTPLEGSNAFPDPWRERSDQFWGLSLLPAEGTGEPVPAAELIVDTITQSDQPVVVFVSGAHTNLAEALRLEPGIAGNIRDVYSMGGSIYAPGNIAEAWPSIPNSTAEWNIWVDPLAAKEVLASGLRLHLVPLDATNRVVWTRKDLRAWESYQSPVGVQASELLRMMGGIQPPDRVSIWDLVAAVQATNPALCPEAELALDVILTPGNEQGRTIVTEGAPNANVCLNPDAEQVKALAAAILGR